MRCRPNLLISSLLLVAGLASAQDRPLPTTWWALANSVNSDDLGLVKQLRSLKWFDACVEWGRGVRTHANTRRHLALQLMLQSDTLLNEADMEHVPKQAVEVGMNTCGVLASLGKPEANNTTTTGSATSAQMVYRGKGVNVYTEAPPNVGNGKVRAVQRSK